jgi:hypothetical protein
MRLSATVGLNGQGWLAVCNAEIEIGPHSDKRTYQAQSKQTVTYEQITLPRMYLLGQT